MSGSALESRRIIDISELGQNPGLFSCPQSQTTQFFFFGVQVSGLAVGTTKVTINLLSPLQLDGDTQGTSTTEVPIVVLAAAAVIPGKGGAIVGTVDVTFTTDFNAQTVTAKLTGRYLFSSLAYTGIVASWANSAT